MTDIQLVTDLQNGDKDAFKTLYERYVKYFYAIALRYASDSHEAEDYVQEAFVRIHKNIHGFNNTGSFEGWIKRILVNHCLNGIKKKNALRNHEDITEMVSEKTGVAPESLDAINTADIMEAISELPTGYRTVLNLFAIEGYSHREIGDRLGITESSSRSQLTKARAKLKRILIERGLLLDEQVRFAS